MLPYRALTGIDPEAIGERVAKALEAGQVIHGSLRLATRPSHESLYLQITSFVQLVINPTIVRVAEPLLDYKNFTIVDGDSSRDFCERVSNLLEMEGWLLYGSPIIYVQQNEFRLCQKLVKP